ncbi:DUF2892 domain-containing protein [Massilia sp. TS11]|uniref:YgaP family membrane protein n=1 Tax=Massilia sp. TS11 TaxID=2908003 RepID=UPI001EDBA6FE|nr:DUF2892 domain-containing protein [Massilia sp. TS11]MCG2583979.1 DUF2892 domain-containing protein [Massilia sp. TS11]
MKTNVGPTDRALRIAVGLTLVAGAALGLVGAWGYLGLIPMATGVIRFCPAYLPFGFNTCSREEA